MFGNWAEVFTVIDAEIHDKAVSSQPYFRHTEFMAGGCVNLPIIPVCHRAMLFDLDTMCMFGSTAQTEKGNQTVQSALSIAGNQQFKAVCV